MRSKRRGESALKLLTARAFYRLLDRITGIRIPLDVGDFRLMSRRALDQLNQLREKDRFVRGLVSWIGFPQAVGTTQKSHRYVQPRVASTVWGIV